VEERRLLRDARGLRHRVGDDDDAEIFAQFVDQFFDPRRRDRIERRARLVHQDHVGIDRHGARNDEALLLAAGERGSRRRQAILHFVPEPGPLQRAFNDAVEFALGFRQSVDARPIGHVVVDRFRERIGLLEHHAHALAQRHGIDRLVIDVDALDLDHALHARAFDRVVHAVDAAQEGGLAAPGGADERGHRPVRDIDRDRFQRLLVAVEHRDVPRGHFHGLGGAG